MYFLFLHRILVMENHYSKLNVCISYFSSQLELRDLTEYFHGAGQGGGKMIKTECSLQLCIQIKETIVYSN